MTDQNEEAFRARVERGELIEANDWMPESYRSGVLKFLEMHANSEIMGAPARARVDPTRANLAPQDVAYRESAG